MQVVRALKIDCPVTVRRMAARGGGQIIAIAKSYSDLPKPSTPSQAIASCCFFRNTLYVQLLILCKIYWCRNRGVQVHQKSFEKVFRFSATNALYKRFTFMQQCFRKLNLISDQYQHAETHPSPLQRSLYKWCREGFRCIKCSVCALETFSNLIQVTSACILN